jgi:hypothetical protein
MFRYRFIWPLPDVHMILVNMVMSRMTARTLVKITVGEQI